MDEISHRKIMETWFQRFWNEKDSSAVDEMFKPDTRARGLGSQTLVGPDLFKGFQQQLLALVSDLTITIDNCISEGDWVCTLCSLTGKCPQTGKDVLMTGTVYVRIEDNVLAEGYNHFDFMGLYEQLGLVPEGSFDECLTGKKIA